MKKKLSLMVIVFAIALIFSVESCIPSVVSPQPNVKYDTTYSLVGQKLNDCAGKSLTITKGTMRLTELIAVPANTITDSVVYTFTAKANELQLVDGNQKRYESNEKMIFQVKYGPNTPSPILNWTVKFNLESNDHKMVVINFKIHGVLSSPYPPFIQQQNIVVDKGLFDLTNAGCLLY